jgi:lipoyl(octanoyl) transferase
VRPLVSRWLGRLAYAEGLALQERLVAARRAGRCPDTLLLLEHPPVVTLGRGAREENLLRPRDVLERSGIEVHEIGRGGDVTWHAPGQLVGYPILDLDARGVRDVHRYLRALEAVLCRVLRDLGLAPWLREGYTGVFVRPLDARRQGPPRKIASIGVGVRGWVTFHGFALNVDLDLRGFENIVPCGLHDVEMTSIARELGTAAPSDLGKRCRAQLAAVFQRLFDPE